MKIIIILSFVCGLALPLNAQKVFSVDHASQADVKVFVVDYASQSDQRIYFVEYASQADVKIFFVDYKSQCGWSRSSKKHLFY